MKTFDPFLYELLQDKEFFDEYYKTHYRDEIGIQLIQLRMKRDLTQTQLAEMANTTQTVVSRLENSTVKPSLETVRKLAEALDAVLEINIFPKEDLIAENKMNCLVDIPEFSEEWKIETHQSLPLFHENFWISSEQKQDLQTTENS